MALSSYITTLMNHALLYFRNAFILSYFSMNNHIFQKTKIYAKLDFFLASYPMNFLCVWWFSLFVCFLSFFHCLAQKSEKYFKDLFVRRSPRVIAFSLKWLWFDRKGSRWYRAASERSSLKGRHICTRWKELSVQFEFYIGWNITHITGNFKD